MQGLAPYQPPPHFGVEFVHLVEIWIKPAIEYILEILTAQSRNFLKREEIDPLST